MFGTIKKVIGDRGFGFIQSDDGKDIFWHCKDLAPGLVFSEALTGERVEFETVEGEKGLKAADVRLTHRESAR